MNTKSEYNRIKKALVKHEKDNGYIFKASLVAGLVAGWLLCDVALTLIG